MKLRSCYLVTTWNYTYEPIVLMTACTRPVQTKVREGPSMGWRAWWEVLTLATDLLSFDNCWEEENQF